MWARHFFLGQKYCTRGGTISKQIIDDKKTHARDEAKLVRQILHGKLTPAIYEKLNGHLLGLLKEIAKKDHVVAGFWSMGSEVDTRLIISDISRLGHTVCLPAIATPNAPLVFRQFDLGDELIEGLHSTKEPSSKAPEVTPDILLVPLLAFDQAGNRLGYGGGYYDRTISQLRKDRKIITIGLSFSGQMVKHVPHDEHDIKLDYIITERGLLGGLEML